MKYYIAQFEINKETGEWQFLAIKDSLHFSDSIVELDKLPTKLAKIGILSEDYDILIINLPAEQFGYKSTFTRNQTGIWGKNLSKELTVLSLLIKSQTYNEKETSSTINKTGLKNKRKYY